MALIPLPDDLALKLERATQLVSELAILTSEFELSAPTTLVPVRADSAVSDLGNMVAWGVKASVPTTIPGQIRAVAGDAVQNIRASLDYLARALVSASGRTPSDTTGRRTQFPISYRQSPVEVHPGVNQEALKIIRALQPGPSGGKTRHPLAMLHELSNADKHRQPLVAAAGTALSTAFLIRTRNRDPPYGIVSPLARWLRNGEWAVMPAFPFPDGDEVAIDTTVRTTLTLAGSGAIMPPLAEDIGYLLNYVRHDVIPRFEPYFAAPWDSNTFSPLAIDDPIHRAQVSGIDRDQVNAAIDELRNAFPTDAAGERRVIVMGLAEYFNVDPRLVDGRAGDAIPL